MYILNNLLSRNWGANVEKTDDFNVFNDYLPPASQENKKKKVLTKSISYDIISKLSARAKQTPSNVR